MAARGSAGGGVPSRPASWAEDVRAEERRLQEYLCQKQHAVLLQGAARELAYTLEPAPTTSTQDGLVHFGDLLMLSSRATGGLLQADPTGSVPVPNASQSGPAGTGAPLSTGLALAACPRSVLTVSRVRDDDGFGEDPRLHYGQLLRLGTGSGLQDRPMYVLSAAAGAGQQGLGDEVLGEGETLACLYARAAAGTQWRAVPAGDGASACVEGDPVRIGAPVLLESAAGGRGLRSDRTVRMTRYGNEFRVFCGGASSSSSAPSAAVWSFVDSQWVEEQVTRARGGGAIDGRALAPPGDGEGPRDPVRALVQDPVFRAEHDLLALDKKGGGARAYAVLERVFPLLRSKGMHVAGQLRKMCAAADVEGDGTVPLTSFQGLISGIGIRIHAKDEVDQLVALFGTDRGRGRFDYLRFFALLGGAVVDGVRLEAVKDAYSRLRSLAPAGVVEVAHIRQHWNPQCHPEVQRGEVDVQEARQDFLRQWNVAAADGSISFEEFLDYYKDVSMVVERDQDFVEVVRRGWDL